MQGLGVEGLDEFAVLIEQARAQGLPTDRAQGHLVAFREWKLRCDASNTLSQHILLTDPSNISCSHTLSTRKICLHVLSSQTLTSSSHPTLSPHPALSPPLNPLFHPTPSSHPLSQV